MQARQTEVDFLLRRGREYLALEVKTQSRFSLPQAVYGPERDSIYDSSCLMGSRPRSHRCYFTG